MRKGLKPFWVILLFGFFVLLVDLGCSSAPPIKDPQSLPSIVRAHKHIIFYRGGSDKKDTGISIQQGDIYSIIPNEYTFRYALSVTIGADYKPFPSYHNKATSSGTMTLGFNFKQFAGNVSYMSVDVLVWESEDWVQIADVFKRMKEKDPKNEAVSNALDEANRREEIFLAEVKASQEIEAVKKQMQALKERPGAKPEQTGSSPTKESPLASGPPSEEKENREKLAQLEQKLVELMGKQAELEEMKQALNEERKKADSLAQELEDLRTRLQSGPKTLPVIVVASPTDGLKVERKAVDLSGVAEADLGLERIEISVNNQFIGERSGERPRKEGDHPRRLEFRERIPLVIGENRIRIRAIDADGLSAEKSLTIHCDEPRRNIWAVVIGINGYKKAPQLKYAVNDAQAFYDYLVKKTGIPRDNVTLLLDQEASLSALRSTLGTQLKSKAGKEDMVILYFAGHGSTESDVMSPDGDGLEKYLLPFDADPKDLYASALPMREISYILQRIRSERLVFIIDSCYSGASGGRTLRTDGTRANISDRFLDRIVSGKGTIILTASGANEVSMERDDLRHGVFTYFLLDGLGGKADMDRDEQITVDEAYAYVARNVPNATGQEQHPVKKGAVEGHLILGILR